MTQLEIYQSAFAEVGALYPHLRINTIQGLVWISEAVHQLQMETGVGSRITSWQLNPNSTDGKYVLPECPGTYDLLEYFSTGAQTSTIAHMYDYHSFEEYKNGALGYGQIVDLTTYAQPLIYTSVGCDLWIWPFTGISGSLRLHYKPDHSVYSPAAKGEWAKYGSAPEAQMALNSLPREFSAAHLAIKRYVMARMLQSIPNWKELYYDTYAECMAEFRDGKRLIVRNNPPQAKDVPPIHRMIKGLR